MCQLNVVILLQLCPIKEEKKNLSPINNIKTIKRFLSNIVEILINRIELVKKIHISFFWHFLQLITVLYHLLVLIFFTSVFLFLFCLSP